MSGVVTVHFLKRRFMRNFWINHNKALWDYGIPLTKVLQKLPDPNIIVLYR